MVNNNSLIKIPDPKFGSDLSTTILDLEKLRTKKLIGEIPPYIFFQLKDIFQILETLGSARIEGNHTTLSEYVEKIIEKSTKKDEQGREIENLEKGIDFIEKNTDEDTKFSRTYFSEIHKIITKDLTPPPNGEGSKNPGSLRRKNVTIKKSDHIPPDVSVLQEHFDEFIDFLNKEHKEQYQLLKVAIAHHRFAYIHPYDNGNGRMGRLLNYALLIKLGFKVKSGRIINPSCVFYSDRDEYYNMLNKADSLKDKDVLIWAEYFLLGLKNEIEKIDSLLGNEYVKTRILLPAINFALERENITNEEYKILRYLVDKKDMIMKSQELNFLNIKDSKQKSLLMLKLRDKKIVYPLKEGGRKYTINFANNYLLRSVIKALEKQGFVADFLNRN
jgi:Fic family protein